MAARFGRRTTGCAVSTNGSGYALLGDGATELDSFEVDERSRWNRRAGTRDLTSHSTRDVRTGSGSREEMIPGRDERVAMEPPARGVPVPET